MQLRQADRGGTTAASVQTHPSLEVHDGLPDDRLLRRWDELAAAVDAAPWLRPGWLLPWWRTMGSGRPEVLVLRGPGGDARAVLPMQRTRAGLVSPTNWHSPELAVVAADEAARREVLVHAFTRCGGRLSMDFASAELAAELASVAAAGGGRSSCRVLESSPWLSLAAGWDADLAPHLLAELRRRGRRLAERGTVTFELRDGTEQLGGLLEEGLRVEASGWKARQGTAVISTPATREFYTSMARWAAEQGWLRLAFLRLDDRALAFDLALEHAGTHFLLKTGYDEGERAAAPGKHLRHRVLHDCADRGIATYEFLGQAQPWKLEWTPLLHDRMQVHAFPGGSAGMRSWAVHARLRPAARVLRDRVAS